jgi:glycosyltransferase involved in cell wall biosynthesis
MLKVALIHDIIAPYRTPLFANLARHPDIDLTVVLSASTSSRRHWNVDPTTLPYPYIIARSKELVWGKKEAHSWFVSIQLTRTLRRLDPDLLVVGGYGTPSALMAFLWGVLHGRPVVLWSESHQERRKGVLRRAKQWSVRSIIKRCNAFIVPGSMARDYLIELGAAPDAIFVSPNSVDLALFKPGRGEVTLRNRIFVPGQLVERKGWIPFLDALIDLTATPPLELVVAGEGPLEDTIRRRLSEMNIKTEFLGHLPYEHVASAYQNCDLMLFPTQEDIWGFVLQEAAASGLPLVASRAAGATLELVTNGLNGWVIEPNARDIRAALEEFLATPLQERKRMGIESRRVAEQFSTETATEGFLKAIRYARAADNCGRR